MFQKNTYDEARALEREHQLRSALEEIYEMVDYRGTDKEIKQIIEQALKGEEIRD